MLSPMRTLLALALVAATAVPALADSPERCSDDANDTGEKKQGKFHIEHIGGKSVNSLNITTDPKTGHILGDDAAAKLWSREYDPRWRPVV